ncbi:MAG TPA: hypothetical protein VFN78_02625 [Ktedonobacterales bacterium]|nr:hypothetical protein [Ktedonobacterales bacterium]
MRRKQVIAMDDAALLAKLARLDDPVYGEYPGGWAHWGQAAAEAQFLRLVDMLAARLECPTQESRPSSRDPGYDRARERALCYETGAYVQDASFHGDILLPQVLLTAEALAANSFVGLRTSNFGHLAMFYDDDTEVRPAAHAIILEALEELGYTFVPSRVLTQPCTGQNHGVNGFSTWGMRYFDYV